MSIPNDDLLVRFILNTKIFGGLTNRQAWKLLGFCKQISLSFEQTLFNKGDSSDELYILIKGQLFAFLEQGNKRQIIGTINIGETVGELGVLSNKPRSMTIKAKTNAVLLSISQENFRQFMTKYANTELWLELINTMINRSQSVIKLLANEKIYHHVALIPATSSLIPLEFCDFLKEQIKPKHNLRVIDSLFLKQQNLPNNVETISKLISESENEGYTLVFIINEMENLKYYINHFDKKEMDITFENVDAVYAVADSREPLDLNPYVKYLFQSDKFPFISRKAIVLLHETELSALPINTQQWLEKENFTLHHHLRYKNSADFQRLLRFIIEKPNGLVLSGGGTKIWASVGIIQALQTLKIPIDAIAGTSAGAGVGGLWTLSQNHETLQEILNPITAAFDKLFALNNLSYPILSINNGRKYTEALQAVFKDVNIEDLWLPNFYICCDLNTGEEICLDRGPLWKAIRASSSLPLIFPPVVNNGHLYVDGGLLNNMPVDQMRNRICQSCFIIAIDLSVPPFKSNYNFPPIIPFTTGLGARLKLRHRDYIYPPLLETFINSLLIGSSSKTDKNGLMADILLKPDVSKFSMMKINKNKIPIFIKDSFQFAINELEDLIVDKDTGVLSMSPDKMQ